MSQQLGGNLVGPGGRPDEEAVELNAEMHPFPGRKRAMKQLAAFRGLRSLSSAKPSVPKWGATLLMVGLLSAPSIWMLSVVPPLWKDIDAYIQVTQPPGPQTILQYGPLYCLVARIPLYLGYVIDCRWAGNSIPFCCVFSSSYLNRLWGTGAPALTACSALFLRVLSDLASESAFPGSFAARRRLGS